MSLLRSQFSLECPSCGKTGTATILSDASTSRRTANAPDGFFVRLAGDNELQLGCTDCLAVAYEMRGAHSATVD
jgi:hypothetical protein